MKIKVTNETNSLLNIFPQGNILNQINCDHIYSSRKATTDELSEEDFINEEEDFSDSSEESGLDLSKSPHKLTNQIIFRANPDKLQSFRVSNNSRIFSKHAGCETDLTKDKHSAFAGKKSSICSANSGMEDQGNSAERESPIFISDPRDNDLLSINAESIQKGFQNMICMTSLTSISDLTNKHQNVVDPAIKTTSGVTYLEQTSTIKPIIPTVNKVKLISSTSRHNAFAPFTIMDRSLDKQGKVCVKVRIESFNNKSSESPSNAATGNTKLDQNTIEMTDEKTCGENKPKPSMPNTSTSEVKRKSPRIKRAYIGSTQRKLGGNPSTDTSCENKTKETKSVDATEDDKHVSTVNDKEFKEISREYENDREMNVKIKYTLDLLIQKWGEYLTMTTEEINRMELENARELNMAGEVIEMLEDKDRYVWQLIDELKFFMN